MRPPVVSFALMLLVITQYAFAQKLTILDSSQRQTVFRGISVVSESIFWVSGSRGTVGRSTDGGNTFSWVNPGGFEKRDFRDVQAFGSETAVIMAIDSPGIILKTVDGGQTWKEVYRNDKAGIFLDDMHFYGSNGMCVGDAMNGRLTVLQTFDAGNSWQEIAGPVAIGAEGCFAASGTNLLMTAGHTAFVTGGVNARIHFYEKGNWKTHRLPIMQGTAMTGPNSLRPLGKKTWVIAGGDYNSRLRSDSSWVIYHPKTHKGLAKHSLPYCSVVVPINKKHFFAAGLNGWFLAEKRHREWHIEPINPTAAHTAGLGKDGRNIYAAGPLGRIMKLELQ